MATEVETGHESEFHLQSGDTPGTFTELGEILEVPLPAGAAELIRASHMKSQGFHDYIASPLQEGEEADVVMNYIPNSATDQLCRASKGKTRGYRIVLRDGDATWEITGTLLVRDYVRTNPMDDRRTATLRVKWVSEATEAAGA